ncbi:MAG: rhamnulokinase [Eubacterium sp.]|nr:rhamnulokinase [Eubacterium sp.]MCM1216337.1 rhamnulokinase [Lachnospiraceae bacterium]MCM1305184.1 rhamnulokinase [Butyrivibrio sp.]MCM1342890.1 rhamnulokinase [Muribaculaceae bacterium]MCM1240104.1 rhamnulokinase [Lachnospiraceae bacterium]
MDPYYLGIDIGASSGRHILAHLEDGRMVLEEIHRFPNGMVEKDGENVWDVEGLFGEIKAGMKKCVELGKIPVSVGIDTWGVDFVLLDEDGNRIGNAVAYRDGRTKGMDEEVYKIIPEDELYARTGIQKQIFNTIYQLMALKTKKPEQLANAKTMLMMPDYFHFLLSGVAATEYTNATTGQLVDPETKDWDMELIRKLGYPEEIFQKIVTPGTVLGDLTAEIQNEVGFNCKVIAPATHDTGSAVIAVPTDSDNTLYISSGTWSLMGTELFRANCSKESKANNLTNEGGYDYRFRYLKNIMGLWMIQSVKKEIGGSLGFGEISEQASQCTIASIVDCNDDRFLAPANMTEEVRAACRESGQQVPEGLAEVACVIYNSLAQCYGKTIQEIAAITGQDYDRIHIVGGGSNADYLNRLTAKATGLPVYAGPTEATAIGNLAAQMMALGDLGDLKDARACVFRSFPIATYK